MLIRIDVDVLYEVLRGPVDFSARLLDTVAKTLVVSVIGVLPFDSDDYTVGNGDLGFGNLSVTFPLGQRLCQPLSKMAKGLCPISRHGDKDISPDAPERRKTANAQPAQQGRYIVRIMHKTTRSGGNVRGRRRDHVRTGQPKSSGQIRTVSCEAESQVIV